MTQQTQTGDTSWFTLRIEDTETSGVEIPKLVRLLDDLSSSFYTIARFKRGVTPRRPGPRASGEESLAGFRLMRVAPGSTVIELAPPPNLDQMPLLADELTADDVALAFYEEIEQLQRGEHAPPDRLEIRRTVRVVLEDAAAIGPRAEIRFRPRSSNRKFQPGQVLAQVFSTSGIPEEEEPRRIVRDRVVSGHAYMVDVEPGRQRVRIKLPDGRDVTMEVEAEALEKIREALDQPVELEIEEEADDQTTIKRTVKDLSILPSSGPGSDMPPKTIEELEREQALPSERPDYVAIASEIWTTEREQEEFLEYLREIRRVGS